VLPSPKYFRYIMFAIVNIAGQQFKVRQNDELFVHRLEGNSGDKVEFSDVLMVSNEGNITVGPNSQKVQAEIIGHLKGDKVIIFHKKRRKGYQKKNGFRQSLTRIKINEIA
jgi:large subunit ribosomal protein L21